MNNTLIDELEIIKELGKGGFGIVYLAKAKDGNLYALKKVFKDKAEHAKKELNALELYQKFFKSNKSGNLLEIIDIKITDEEISYLMPLADGVDNKDPLDENYKPLTLKALVDNKYSKEEVFSKDDILSIFLPLFKAVTNINNKGIVHRDIKPENIIFIKGKPYLADIGLMREDNYSVSSAGTLDYYPSSEYIDTGGKVDMWSLAATIFYVLGRNPPDKMGRPNFVYPKHKKKMAESDIKAWWHFYTVILRATREKAIERYISFEDFTDSFKNINKKEIDFSKLDNPNFHSSIFSLKGRLRRRTFAICYTIPFLLSMFIEELRNSIELMDIDNIWGYISFIPMIILMWPSITLIVKRVHDAGLNGFWGLLIFFLVDIFTLEIIMAEDCSHSLGNVLYILSFSVSLFIALILKSEKKINKYGVPNQKITFFN